VKDDTESPSARNVETADGEQISSRATRKHSTPLQKILVVIGSISLAVAIITLTFMVLLTPWPTQFFASKYVDDADSPMSHDYLVEVACQTLEYSNGNKDADLPVGDDYRTSFTPDVFEHLDDVAVFFTGMKVAAVVSSVVLAVVLFALWRTTRRWGSSGKHVKGPDGLAASAGEASGDSQKFKLMVSRTLLAGVVIVLALLLLIAIAAFIDFNTIFNALHSLFFSADSWLFPYDSLLICSLPERFWEAMAALWAVMLLVVMVVLIVVAVVLRKKSKRAALVEK
jgi:hypothetical protein